MIAPDRSGRPDEFARPSESQVRADPLNCPFCPGNESMTPPQVLAYGEGEAWRLRVVPNKYPAVGSGGHEVIIESREHDAGLGPDLFEAARERMNFWRERDQSIRYIQFFKNSGAAAGASIAHPHSQLITLPMVPKQVQDELEGARQYRTQANRCVFCELIESERRDRSRMIFETEQVAVFAPAAPRFAFETWILPKSHESHFEHSDPPMLRAVASALQVVIGRLERAANHPAYNLILHTAPLHDRELAHYHWHLELLPRIAGIAGFEWATGYYINALAPEAAAELLRRAGQGRIE